MKVLNLATALALSASMATADGTITYTTDEAFDDVVFGLENAIVGEGLVIDSVSHTGDMLERTKADVGGTITIFDRADVFSFCSAALSRKVMEIDPMNVRFCPYDIFVAQRPGEPVMIGFSSFPEGEMQEVQALLDRLARSAIGLD